MIGSLSKESLSSSESPENSSKQKLHYFLGQLSKARSTLDQKITQAENKLEDFHLEKAQKLQEIEELHQKLAKELEEEYQTSKEALESESKEQLKLLENHFKQEKLLKKKLNQLEQDLLKDLESPQCPNYKSLKERSHHVLHRVYQTSAPDYYLISSPRQRVSNLLSYNTELNAKKRLIVNRSLEALASIESHHCECCVRHREKYKKPSLGAVTRNPEDSTRKINELEIMHKSMNERLQTLEKELKQYTLDDSCFTS